MLHSLLRLTHHPVNNNYVVFILVKQNKNKASVNMSAWLKKTFKLTMAGKIKYDAVIIMRQHMIEERRKKLLRFS